jgi:hypothetical protein
MERRFSGKDDTAEAALQSLLRELRNSWQLAWRQLVNHTLRIDRQFQKSAKFPAA